MAYRHQDTPHTQSDRHRRPGDPLSAGLRRRAQMAADENVVAMPSARSTQLRPGTTPNVGRRHRTFTRFAADALAGFLVGMCSLVVVADVRVALTLATCAAVVGPLVLALLDGYAHAPGLPGDPARGFGRLLLAGSVVGWVSLLAGWTLGLTIEPGWIVGLFGGIVVAWMLVRSIAARLLAAERIVVLGSGDTARRVHETVKLHAHHRVEIIGCLDDHPGKTDPEGPAVLGGLHELEGLLAAHAVDRVIVAFSRAPDASTLDLLRQCDMYDVDVDVVPRMFDLIGPEMRSYSMGGLPMVTVRARRGTRTQQFVKRAFDVVVAGAMLAVFAPLMAVIALAVRIHDGGPSLFRQRRAGRAEQPFEILKFRTMKPISEKARQQEITDVAADKEMSAVVAELKAAGTARTTRIGSFLRRSSLDELPQLINVVRGDMSLVGPRPLQAYEAHSLQGWQTDRMLMRPGITGLWQTTGRSRVNWQERVALDYLYVRHWSLSGDLRILVRTMPSLLASRGEAR